jgi:hypothetical protein
MLLTDNLKDKVVIERFVDCIEPGMLYDIARLPYVGKINGNAFSTSEICCIFALIAHLIFGYWAYVETEDPDCIIICKERIERLKLTCDNYKTSTVYGDPAKGYWLE